MDKDTLILIGIALVLVFLGWIDFRESSRASSAPRKIRVEYDDGVSYLKMLVTDVDFFNWKTLWAMAIMLALGGLYNEAHVRHKSDASKRWEEAEARNKERSRQYLERFNNDGFVSKEQEAHMEELAKEQKPAQSAKGFAGRPRN